MRKVELRSDGNFQKIYLNNKELTFQLGLLDQGYWPDGILTPPTEEAMKWDMEQTQKMGFNMIRKHIKIESKRFVVKWIFITNFNIYLLFRWYYWTDKLGLLVWQDFPCITDTISMEEAAGEAREGFRREARRWLDQLGHHPSIILWVVFNEGWGQHDTVSLTNMVMEVGMEEGF